jgi:hypothetical protein
MLDQGMRLVAASAKAQAQLTRGNIEDLRPLFGRPLVALVSMPILVHSAARIWRRRGW